MKTERRHELQTNTLASSLARWIESIKPYSTTILAGAIALVVAVGVWAYLSRQSSSRAADGWNEYFAAMNSRDPRDTLSDVAERYAGLQVAEWATLALADFELEDGTNRLFIAKADARDELNDAVRRYQAVLLDSPNRLLKERARFGLARTLEALGQLDKAREQYELLAKEWPDSAYRADAESRAKDLAQGNTRDFYDWFAKYERPRIQPGQGIPGLDPKLQEMLDKGELHLPELNKGSLLPSVTDTPAAAASKPETADDEKPAEEKPADDKPADDKPTEDKPTEDKPTEDKPTDKPAESKAEEAKTDGAPKSGDAPPEPPQESAPKR